MSQEGRIGFWVGVICGNIFGFIAGGAVCAMHFDKDASNKLEKNTVIEKTIVEKIETPEPRRGHATNKSGQSMEVVENDKMNEWFIRHLDFKIDTVVPLGDFKSMVIMSAVKEETK